MRKKISDEPLSIRLKGVLESCNIKYVDQLETLSKAELLKYRNFGNLN